MSRLNTYYGEKKIKIEKSNFIGKNSEAVVYLVSWKKRKEICVDEAE